MRLGHISILSNGINDNGNRVALLFHNKFIALFVCCFFTFRLLNRVFQAEHLLHVRITLWLLAQLTVRVFDGLLLVCEELLGEHFHSRLVAQVFLGEFVAEMHM